MKKRYLLICFVFVLHPVMAQKAYFDSLKHLVVNAKTDSERFRRISELINNYYGRYNPDSSIIYGNQLTAWGKKLNNKSIMVTGLRGVAFGMYNKGDYPGALNNGLNALRIIENTHDTVSMAWTYSLVGDIYKGQQNYSRALYYYQHAKQLSRTFRGLVNWSEPDLNLAFVYERTNVLDSALHYAQRYLSDKDNLGPKGSANYMYGILGNVYFKLKKYDTALGYYRKGYNIAKNQNKSRGVSEMGINLSNFYAHTNKPDSAIHYARQALLAAKKVSYNKSVYEAATLLGSLYESRKMPDSAFKYLKLSSVTKDSLYNAAKAGEVADLTVSELARQNEIQAANAAYRSSLRIYVLGGALLVFLAMALLQWINSGQKKRAYELLKKQKEEIEAQRAQALIEAALEKVRGRSLAMHASNELQEVVNVVFEKLNELGITMDSVVILIPDEATKGCTHWISNSDKLYSTSIYVPFFDTPLFSDFWRAKEAGAGFITKTYTREEKNSYFEYVFEHTDFKNATDDRKKQILASEGFGTSWAITNNAAIQIINYTGNLFSENENRILKRFANVFEQAYVRFMDLQKAEEQARETQIQLGLERVRARAMAMQTTEELNALVATVFEELTKLDFVLTRCLIMIFDPQTLGSRWWMANSEDPANPMSFFVQNHDSPAYNSYVKAWGERRAAWRYELKGKIKEDWDSFLFVDTELSQLPAAVIKGMTEPDKVLLSAAFNNFGCLTLVSLEPLSNEHSDIMLRFARVFDMSYTRFNDLRQAEEQAREAKIEASLERVRAKTMAMHNSADIGNTAASMFDELVKLGIETSVRCGILIIDKKTKYMEVWAAASDKTGKASLLIGSLDMSIHPLLQQLYIAWENKEPHFLYELRGDDLKNYYRAITEAPDYPFQYDLQSIPDEQMTNLFFFPEGGIFAFTVEPLSEDVANLFKRFAAVFGLTYRRFLDLQKAEAQTQEVVKQASVDRVRAEIASMRSTTDLERITPLIWNELTTLGVPFIRCGVFIMDENGRIIHTYLSTPDGQALAAFQLSFDTDGIGKAALAHWRKNQIYTTHWTEEEFAAFSKGLVDRGAVESDEKYRTSHPPTSLDLHFFPFLQGMLYVGNIAPLGEGEMNMVQSLAEAFSTAYARYEDFNKLELAKLQVDKTLTELKDTQRQLIQSEKMASLGELTAGVAHEIQNPLNFVNNFSEVSIELLDEMQAELESGDKNEAIAIAADVKQNLEKIRHHGGRADGIVKGMLQHSRASSAQKEPSDLNALADEYLRLAYHGLRAKDKSFNIELTTNFDKKLPNVSIVPQDIGRVLINLYNNAFYATQQKAKTAGTGYKPEVTVTTCREDSEVIIKVKDNGNGIPDAIKDKIMQPFFTTKPTGEGTGLGLSLSYDIVVKGHGGSISVDTKEGELTEFTITLPLN